MTSLGVTLLERHTSFCVWPTPRAMPVTALIHPPLTLSIHQVAPTAMVFVPCHNGWSHRPDEHATPEDIERGVRVLALTLARLAGAASGEHSEL